jgi:LuxR family maltose regulon positive regulatory protein
LSMQSFALLIIGNAYRFEGDLKRSIELHDQALIRSETVRDTFLSVMILSRLIDIYRTMGHLRLSHQTGLRAIEIIGGYQKQTGMRSFILGYLKLHICGTYYERNQIESALQYAEAGLDLVRKWGGYDSISLGYFHLSRIHKALGNLAQANAYLREFKEIFPSKHRFQYQLASALEAELDVQSGRLQDAIEWMQSCGLSTSDPIRFLDIPFFDVFTQVLLAQNKIPEAQSLLERLCQVVEGYGAIEYKIKILGRTAVVLQKMGEEDSSIVKLTRALALAAPEGYLRSFLDQGESMIQLLYRAASQGIYPEFCNRLLSSFSSSTKSTAISQNDLLEPLSSREVEVLTYIADGDTNQEIAQALHLSLFTVKSHARNIYGKLGVKNRTEAVARARLLGLLKKD